MLRSHGESTHTVRDAIGAFEYRFTPTSAIAIRLSRNVFAQWLRAQPGMNVDGIDDLLVAASELCTNAVTHASGATYSVAIRAAVEGDAVVFEVEDDGRGFPDPGCIELDTIDAAAEHGRGLFIVQRLVDRVEFDQRNGSMVVRCCKDGMLRHRGVASDQHLSDEFQRDN